MTCSDILAMVMNVGLGALTGHIIARLWLWVSR